MANFCHHFASVAFNAASAPREACKPFYAGTSAAQGLREKNDKAVKGRDNVCRSFRALIICDR